MQLEAVFLDVDGVINDINRLGRLWSAIGEILAPELGLKPADWSNANNAVFPTHWAGRDSWGREPGEWFRNEACSLLSAMCQHLNVPVPSEEHAALLMHRVDIHVAGTCAAVVPGAASVIRTIGAAHAVHLASGNASWRNEAMLTGLDLQDTVGLRCGPDLVGSLKNTRDFYRGAFAMAQVDPRSAMVVDDDARQVAFATGIGARAIHVAMQCREPCGAVGHIAELRGLPRALGLAAIVTC